MPQDAPDNRTPITPDDPLVEGITMAMTGFVLLDRTNHKVICTAPTRAKLERLAAEELKRRAPGDTTIVKIHSVKVRYS